MWYRKLYRAQLTVQPMSSQASAMGTPAPYRVAAPVEDDPEASMKAALIDLRCLYICISLLERVNSVSLIAPGRSP